MSADAIHDLADRHGVTFELVEGFLYPGHSVARMHGTPNRTGQELMAMLVAAADNAGLDVLTSAHVTKLFVTPDDRVRGVEVTRPDGASANRSDVARSFWPAAAMAAIRSS